MSYHELNLEERIAIRVGLVQKLSLREIARQLKRSPSTISWEVRRNSDADGNYTAYGAYQHTKARRVTCRPKRKLEPSNELFLMVKEMLRDRFSPQQIAGNLRRMLPKLKDAYVSHETIYNAIYALPVGELRKELIHCLRHGKTTRRPRTGGVDRRNQIPDMAIDNIQPDSLTIHQDRGVPMTAHCYLDLLGELAITASHSRPRVSNDNAMSEALFKTLKYQPDYPRRFDSYNHTMRWCEDYVQWYNHQHHHSSLAGFTPHPVFSGEYQCLAKTKQAALDEMYSRHPERFTRGRPIAQMPPSEVCINPVPEDADQATVEKGVNFPTLKRAIEKIR